MSTYPVRSTTTGIRDPSPLSMYNTVSSTITRVVAKTFDVKRSYIVTITVSDARFDVDAYTLIQWK